MKYGRGFLIAILMALVVAVPLLYSAHRHTTVRNFRVVEDGVLYRSGQLSPEVFQRTLDEYGIKLVVTLRTVRDPSLPYPDEWEARLCAERNVKLVRAGNKDAAKLGDLLDQVAVCLNQGKPARTMQLDAAQLALLKPLCLLTVKPVMYVANVAEKGFTNNPLLTRMEEFAAREGAPVVAICAALESEISGLSDDEKLEFLTDAGMAEPGLNRLIRTAYQVLGLQTYFTAGVKEVRAWTIHVGDTAPQAAGVIHGDFEKGFIRAEVISYDDFIACKGEAGAKEKGKMRLEGKEYVVQNGDVMHFRFNV